MGLSWCVLNPFAVNFTVRVFFILELVFLFSVDLSALFSSKQAGLFRVLRIPHGLRVFEYLDRRSGSTVGVLEALQHAICTSKKAYVHVFVVILLWCAVVTIVGIHFFSGILYWCDVSRSARSDSNIAIMAEGVKKAFCVDELSLDSEFKKELLNYDSLGEGLLTTLRMLIFAEYSPIFFSSINSVAKGVDGSPSSAVRQKSVGSGLFSLIVAIGNIVLIYVFVAIVYGNFIRKLYIGNRSTIPGHKHALWAIFSVRLRWVLPISSAYPPRKENAMQLVFFNVVTSATYKVAFTGCILLNIAIVYFIGSQRGLLNTGVDTLDSDNIRLMHFRLYFAVGFCSFDILLRMIGYGPRVSFFESKQCFITAVQALTMLLPDIMISLPGLPNTMQNIFVAIGAFRVLLIVPQWQTLWAFFFGIFMIFRKTLPLLASIAVATFVFASFGVIMYQDLRFHDLDHRSWFEANGIYGEFELRKRHFTGSFDTISSSMTILFFGSLNSEISLLFDGVCFQTSGFKRAVAPILFLTYAFIVRIVFLNLVLILVVNLSETYAVNHPDLKMEQIEDFKKKWHEIDEFGKGTIKAHKLGNLLRKLQAPLGIREPNAVSNPPKFRVTRFTYIILRSVYGWKLEDLIGEHGRLLKKRPYYSDKDDSVPDVSLTPCPINIQEQNKHKAREWCEKTFKRYIYSTPVQKLTWSDLYDRSLTEEFKLFDIRFRSVLQAFHKVALFDELKRLPDDTEFRERQTFALDMLSKIKVAIALDARKSGDHIDVREDNVYYNVVEKSVMQRVCPAIYRKRFADAFRKEVTRWKKNISLCGFSEISYFEARQLISSLKEEICAMKIRLGVLQIMPKNLKLVSRDHLIINSYVKQLEALITTIDVERRKFVHQVWVPSSIAILGECYTKNRGSVSAACVSTTGEVLVTLSEGPVLQSSGGMSTYLTFWGRRKLARNQDIMLAGHEMGEHEKEASWRPFVAEHLLAHSTILRCVACAADADSVFVGGSEHLIRSYVRVKQSPVDIRQIGSKLRYKAAFSMEVDAAVHALIVHGGLLISCLDNGFCCIHNFRGGEALQRLAVNDQQVPVYCVAIMDLSFGCSELVAQGAVQAFVGGADGCMNAIPFQVGRRESN